jgi:hypothetical protein
MAGVPRRATKNSQYNVFLNQCVGNKEDYAVENVGTTASLMAYMKAVLGITKPHAGNVFFVDSGHAAAVDSTTNGLGQGTAPTLPFATIDFAIGACTANNGDVIYVMPGHAETLTAASAIDVDVAGVSIIGLGNGAARPTITMNHVDATVELAAANCLLKNILFKVTADSTIVLDVNAADCTIEDCEFRYGTGKEWVTCIDVNGGAANACDRTKIIGCVFQSPVAGAANCIGLDEVADMVLIERCVFRGDFSDAAIHNPTGKVLTRLCIKDCDIENTQTGDHAVELVSACTGTLIRNFYSTNALATAVDPGACFSFECYACHQADKNGVLTPGVDS